MKLSRTASYAIAACVHVAREAPWRSGKVVIGHSAATALGLSKAFLLRIMVGLSRAGILKSLKGPNGGYALGMAANEISVLAIVEAAEGPITYSAELSTDTGVDAALRKACDIACDTWKDSLLKVKLSDLANGKKKKSRAG